MSTAGIAKKLAIAPVTVRNHIQSILQRLDVHSKLAAVGLRVPPPADLIPVSP